MPKTFWTNTIWFILLFITSMASFIAAMVKSKNRAFTVAYTLATLGFVYLIEAILVILLNSYTYYPDIFPGSFMDSVFGNFFSQISISATSALAIEYRLSYKWYILFSIIYFFIEELFLKLGIYQHHWYKSIYTLVGFLGLFLFVKVWYRKIINSHKSLIRYTTLFFAVYATAAHTIRNPLSILGIQNFRGGFYYDSTKDDVATSLVLVILLINTLIIIYKLKIKWVIKGIIFFILALFQNILYIKGIVIYKQGWYPIICFYDLLAPYFWIVLFDRILRNKPPTIEK